MRGSASVNGVISALVDIWSLPRLTSSPARAETSARLRSVPAFVVLTVSWIVAG
jgi:hypothetical protein